MCATGGTRVCFRISSTPYVGQLRCARWTARHISSTGRPVPGGSELEPVWTRACCRSVWAACLWLAAGSWPPPDLPPFLSWPCNPNLWVSRTAPWWVGLTTDICTLISRPLFLLTGYIQYFVLNHLLLSQLALLWPLGTLVFLALGTVVALFYFLIVAPCLLMIFISVMLFLYAPIDVVHVIGIVFILLVIIIQIMIFNILFVLIIRHLPFI